jgi:hypothetical protein
MRDLERYGPLVVVWFSGPLIMALIFGSVVMIGGTPVTPEVYGRVVYEVPALAWAGAQAVAAGVGAVGAAMANRAMTIFGALGLALLFMAFAAGALSAGATGTLLVAMAIGATPSFLLIAWIAWRSGHGGRR